MQQKIEQSYALCGYLDKKSPSLFKGWQRRYFQVRDSGKMLLYYKNAPQGDVKPTGIVQIQQLISVNIVVVSKDRQIFVRAQDEESRQYWRDTLTFLMELIKKEDKLRFSKQLSMVDLSGSNSDNPSETNKIKNQIHTNWSDLDKDTMVRIKLEDEKVKYLKLETQIEEMNEEVLRAKGIYPFLAKYDSDIVNRHVISGFLMKKGKHAKLTVAKKRWFFMISSVVINGDKVDGERINQSDVPSVFKLDAIYYFKYDFQGDKTNFQGEILLDLCEKPELTSLDKSQFIEAIQKYKYGFNLYSNKECRAYNFFSDHLTDINRWVVAMLAVQSRPNKGVQRGSKLLNTMQANINDPEDQQEEEDKLNEEVVIFEAQVDKKHHNKLLTGPLSWRTVTLQLLENIIKWNAKNKDKDENTNQYILLHNILKVEGGHKSWVIFTNDGEVYKFRAESWEKKNEWVKKIQDQAVINKGTFNEEDLKTTNDEKSTTISKKKSDEDEEDDEDHITQSFYKKMQSSMKKNQTQSGDDNGTQSTSLFSKLFCCCSNNEDAEESDKGF